MNVMFENRSETNEEKMLRNVNYELEYIAKRQGFESVGELKDFVDMVNRKLNAYKSLAKRIEEMTTDDFYENGLPF